MVIVYNLPKYYYFDLLFNISTYLKNLLYICRNENIIVSCVLKFYINAINTYFELPDFPPQCCF